jgi:hypothetical protein
VKKIKAFGTLIVLGSLVLSGVSPANAEVQRESTSFTQTFLNPCAAFTATTDEQSVSRLSYGELIEMDFQLDRVLDSEIGFLSLDLAGVGVGERSGLNYQLSAIASVEQNQPVLDQSEVSFLIDAQLVSSDRGIQSNPDLVSRSAGISFRMNMTVSPGEEIELIDVSASNFELTCEDERWENLTSNSLDNGSGGKGFGDPWNKYAWSMKDFNGKMYVGTKNATYNYLQLQNPDSDVQACLSGLAGTIPSIYLGMACLELFDSNSETDGIIGTESRPAEIWGYDYDLQQWALTYPGLAPAEFELSSQGFRVMEEHRGQLYAGSDLGSFIMGVELGSQTLVDGVNKWNFPGSRILANDGVNGWLPIECSPSVGVPGPCNFSSAPLANSASEGINISFRALASHQGGLYLGTFNFSGAELWKYEESDSSWSRIAKFNGTNGLPFSASVAELKSHNGKLMIGLGFGPSLTSAYLWEYDSDDQTTQVVPGLPAAANGSGVFKLFVSQSDELFVGIVDFQDGFDLLGYNPSRLNSWRTISTRGFGADANRYVWSMEEHDNKLYLGTFNSDLLTDAAPRGSAELWVSRDDGVSWQQQRMPLRWSVLNYGIRTMAVGDGELFMGSASHMLAPDLITEFPGALPGVLNIGAGAEVWRSKPRQITRVPSGSISISPITISLSKVSETTAKLSWTPMSNAEGYRLYVDDKLAGQVTNSVTSHTFVGLSKATTHQIKITATIGSSEVLGAVHSVRTNGSTSLNLLFKSLRTKASIKHKAAITNLAPSLSGAAKVWLELRPVEVRSGVPVSTEYKKLSRKRLASLRAALESAGIAVSTAEFKRLAANSALVSGKYKLVVRYSFPN